MPVFFCSYKHSTYSDLSVGSLKWETTGAQLGGAQTVDNMADMATTSYVSLECPRHIG